MASPIIFISGMTFTLSERLRSSGTETSLICDSTDDSAYWTAVSAQSGVGKLNEGANSEWFGYTGITVGATTNGVTRITFTGVVRGLDKDAASFSDVSSSNKKDHAAGSTLGKIVLHSVHINQFAQVNKANTFSDTNSFTNTNTFISTSVATLNLQRVTTAQRDALTGVAEGSIVKNDTTGLVNVYLGGVWVELGVATAPSNASETNTGVVQKSTDAQVAVATEFGSTGAYLFTTPKQLYGTGTAGETLIRDDFIYVKESDTKLYKTDNVVSVVAESWNCIGVVVIGGNANDTVVFQRLDGEFTYNTPRGFTIGSTLYLGRSGLITATKPSMNDKNVVPIIIGTATSTTKIAFRPQRLQRRILVSANGTGTKTLTVGFPISHAQVTCGYFDGTQSQSNTGYYDKLANTQYTTSGGGLLTGYVGYLGGSANNLSYVASVDVNNDLVLTYAVVGSMTNPSVTALVFEAL